MKDLLIGSHVSMSSPDYFLGSVKEALSYDSATFMFYTGAPQSSYRLPLESLNISLGQKLAKQNNIDLSKVVVHAPYIINLANDSDIDKWENGINLLIKEIKRTSSFGVKTIVLHPGAHMKKGNEYGIRTLAKALDKVLSSDDTDVHIALETMAGKGTEIGICFEEIAQIISLSKYKERLGVCLDTCHINDAGYDIRDFDSILEQFDRIIGLDRLLVIHVNDSKNPISSHKDRHENIGYGEIGFEVLDKIVNHEKLKDIPKILETPYINDLPPYKIEISMFKNRSFIKDWKNNF